MKRAKRLFCLLLALALALALCACRDDDVILPKEDGRGNQVGDKAYTAALTEISESGQALTTFDPTALGKITVLNFWAYWCGPCVNELPHFDRVAQEYGDEVAVIAVHCDELSRAQEFIRINYPDSPIRFAMDEKDDPFAYYKVLGGGGSIPYTVVLDADGIIRKTFVGAINYDTLVATIEECQKE